MNVLDGRNSNAIPKVIEISSFIITDKWTYNNENIYCLQLDGMFVPCVSTNEKRYKYVLCAAYKTQNGFNNWLKKHYPNAIKEVR